MVLQQHHWRPRAWQPTNRLTTVTIRVGRCPATHTIFMHRQHRRESNHSIVWHIDRTAETDKPLCDHVDDAAPPPVQHLCQHFLLHAKVWYRLDITLAFRSVKHLSIFEIAVYRVPATGTRYPQIAYRQSLWLAGMWHATGLQPSPRRLQRSGVKMASTSKRLVIWRLDFLFLELEA